MPKDLTVGDVRRAIKGLPDSALIWSHVISGPDEWTLNLVTLDGGLPQHLKDAKCSRELRKPALWLHLEIIPMND